MKNIVVVGGGLIGARHVAAVQAHPKCHFAGLVDPDPDIPAQYSRMEEVPDHTDGVIIATPTHLHSAHGIYAASRGWHMLIEKPVAGDLKQAEALEFAVGNAGVASLVGHHRRYHSHVQHLRQMISDGAIGSVVTVSLIWAMRKPDRYFADNWRTTDGSPVMINLVHDIDILRFVVGEIADVTALRGKGQRGALRVECGAIALLFENGATGTISFADNSLSPWGFEAGTGENPNIGATGQDMMWVTGTRGAVSFPSMTHWSHSIDWEKPVVPAAIAFPNDTRPPLEKQLDHFIDVMAGRVAPLIDANDARRTLEIALRIQDQLMSQA